MPKNALIIGGGVAGCSCAHFLSEKGWETTIIEASNGLGGMSRTRYFNGHPYEFGPHLWFWPEDDINDIIRHYANNELYELDRKLLSYSSGNLTRYPLHWDDIKERSDFETVKEELGKFRDNNWKLILDKLPKMGKCTFEEYFIAAVGPTLYNMFMRDYTQKMWGIPGSQLTTGMVWADRIKSHYTDTPYDPIKFEDQGLGKGMMNWYPKNGWNQVWEGMAKRSIIFLNEKVGCVVYGAIGTTNRAFQASDYDVIVWTLHTDAMEMTPTLGANGRLILPLVFPNKIQLPEGTESLHLSDNSPVTRITDMSIITGVNSPGILYLFELPGAIPKKGTEYLNQWYHPRCYNHQDEENIARNKEFSFGLRKKIPNIMFCGRHAEFKYFGMPETVHSAKKLCGQL